MCICKGQRKRVMLLPAFQERRRRSKKKVTTQPLVGVFYFTSFICPLSVNTEYIKQCGGDGMVDRKVILTAYKKGLKLLFLYLKKHSLNLKDV